MEEIESIKNKKIIIAIIVIAIIVICINLVIVFKE